MLPSNVNSLVLTGTDLECILFKVAFKYVEQGLHVWFISPKVFTNTPKTPTLPDKDILKLMTFLYLEDYKDLIQHMNGIHKWRRIPNVVIINSCEQYCNFGSDLNYVKVSFILASILDGVKACACKHSKRSILLTRFNNDEWLFDSRFQTLLHLYFQYIVDVNGADTEHEILEHIVGSLDMSE